MSSLLGDKVTVSIESIFTHPENPRKGDVVAISESLKELQQFAPLIIQRNTSYILAGNHTYQAAVLLGWQTIDVIYIDVDDDTAIRILLAANRTADLGGYDEMLLLSILADIREEDEDLLLGTGYSTEDVDELLADALNFMPEDDGQDAEDIAFAASVLDRLMPPSAEEEVEAAADAIADLVNGEEKKATVKRPAYAAPTEFVIFRFGELRAKVGREAYDEFVKAWIKENDNDLSKAGIAAAIHLGVPDDKVEAALAEGTERWL